MKAGILRAGIALSGMVAVGLVWFLSAQDRIPGVVVASNETLMSGFSAPIKESNECLHEARINALEQRLAELERIVSVQSERITTLQATGAPVGAAPAHGGASAQEALEYIEPMDLMDENLELEAVDLHWAPEMEAQIYQAFKVPGAQDSRLIESSCRSTLCRVVIDHPSAKSRDEFMEATAMLSPWNGNGRMESKEAAHGHFETIAFIERGSVR